MIVFTRNSGYNNSIRTGIAANELTIRVPRIDCITAYIGSSHQFVFQHASRIIGCLADGNNVLRLKIKAVCPVKIILTAGIGSGRGNRCLIRQTVIIRILDKAHRHAGKRQIRRVLNTVFINVFKYIVTDFKRCRLQ